jgi:hypothetical protein
MSDLERDGQDLWRRYRATAWMPSDTDPAGQEPAAVLVAAYLERRLDEDAAAPVEGWLARNPDANILIAEFSSEASVPPAPLDVIRRARGLVAAPARPGWRHAAAWASIAASLLIVSTTGFLAGHDAVDRSEAIVSLISDDLVDGPSGDGDGAVF